MYEGKTKWILHPPPLQQKNKENNDCHLGPNNLGIFSFHELTGMYEYYSYVCTYTEYIICMYIYIICIY